MTKNCRECGKPIFLALLTDDHGTPIVGIDGKKTFIALDPGIPVYMLMNGPGGMECYRINSAGSNHAFTCPKRR